MSHRPRPGRLWGALLIALLGCQGGAPADSSAQNPTTRPAQPPPEARLPDAPLATTISASRRSAIVSAVERVAPAVVTVQTETVEQSPVDPLEYLFGRGGGGGRQTRAGIGSGFIVRADGVIVTNAHVVSGATRVSVAMRDGKTYSARVVGSDETNDLAVLKIDARGLPVAPLGNSNDLQIGEWAVAIGNPFGFVLGNTEPSVTAGVISAVGRNLVGGAEGGGVYVDMIQTDAAINPGNSGGPLVNADGTVVGVNSSIYSPSGGSVGLGFAIPINRARRVAEDLLAHGEVRRPYVGLQLQAPRTNNPRELLTAGVVVRYVAPGSPAAQAGVRGGDVLVRVGPRTLRNVYDWEAALLDLRPGESVPLFVRRGAGEQQLALRVADLPELTAPRVTVLRELQLVTVTPAIRAERRIQSSSGALVFGASERVQREIGLEPGDVIVQVNRAQVASADDVARAIDVFAPRGPLRLYFERGGRLGWTDISIRQ
ncbi:MAG TPA: trypsin-like peptidase domain-containing protein [Gemmatirosa sp.]|nr:trypsin-like peptidase domain-containing protein [Gemmatirosa sp.]